MAGRTIIWRVAEHEVECALRTRRGNAATSCRLTSPARAGRLEVALERRERARGRARRTPPTRRRATAPRSRARRSPRRGRARARPTRRRASRRAPRARGRRSGRVRLPRGATRRRPLNSPATILTPGSGRAPEPKRPTTASRSSACSGCSRRGSSTHDLVGAVARSHEQLVVLRQPRDPEHRQAVLARAEHLAGPAQLEVDLGEPEAVALVRDRLEPRQRRVAEQDAERGVLAAAHPPAQLVQLRQAVALGRLDQHHGRVRHVDAHLDHARGHEHVGLAARRTSPSRPPSASTASARGSAPRAGRANSVVRSRSNSAVAALACSASDSSTSGQTTKHCRPGGDLLADPLVRARTRAGAVHHVRLDRPAPARQLAQHGGVEVAVGGERQRARDRRGGHVERVRGEPVGRLRVERGALAHAEAVLLVHHARRRGRGTPPASSISACVPTTS